jgi:hypothetical protein
MRLALTDSLVDTRVIRIVLAIFAWEGIVHVPGC